MKFIRRTTELSKLNKLITKNELNTALIFERRRIGKNELVKHSLKDKKTTNLYYECKEVSKMFYQISCQKNSIYQD